MNDIENTFSKKQDKDRYPRCNESLSWTGIVAGGLAATGLGFLLNLFNIGIGLSIFDYSTQGVMTIMIGGLIAMFIGGFATMFIAGWVSGYISRPYCSNRYMGVLQGFAAWCFALIISLFLIASNVGFFLSSSHLLIDNLSISPTISFTTDEHAPTISNLNPNHPQITVNAEKSANKMGLAAFVTFLVFFLGAIASCLGGYFGACPNSDKCWPFISKINNID